MHLNNYTSIDLGQDQLLRAKAIDYSAYIERVLLFFIAGVGIMGSVYIFSASSDSQISPEYNNMAFAPVITQEDNVAADVKARFSNYVDIEGEKIAGAKLQFTFKKDRAAARYVLEMGNGERMIITGDSWPYSYSEAGEYLLELKKIERGLITLVASKKLKIKK